MQAQLLETSDTQSLMAEIGRAARRGARAAALAPSAVKDAALRAAAREIRLASAAILAANALDVEAARASGASPAALDRLTLDPKRIEAMARGVEEIADLPDPVGRVLAVFERPNGLRIERVTTPLGVIGVIYESRPNVTADAGALCLKSGNATILRGGSDSLRSSAVIHALSRRGARSRRPAGGSDRPRAHDRPRGGGRDARGSRWRHRRDRAARRKEPRRARAARGARAGVRAS